MSAKLWRMLCTRLYACLGGERVGLSHQRLASSDVGIEVALGKLGGCGAGLVGGGMRPGEVELVLSQQRLASSDMGIEVARRKLGG